MTKLPKEFACYAEALAKSAPDMFNGDPGLVLELMRECYAAVCNPHSPCTSYVVSSIRFDRGYDGSVEMWIRPEIAFHHVGDDEPRPLDDARQRKIDALLEAVSLLTTACGLRRASASDVTYPDDYDGPRVEELEAQADKLAGEDRPAGRFVTDLEMAAIRRRIDDLLEANNRYLQQYRDLKAKMNAAEGSVSKIDPRVEDVASLLSGKVGSRVTRQFEGTENKFVYDSEAGYARLDKKYREAAEKPSRIEGMARSFDQWLNMVPHAVADGSKAQVECALADASHDIEVLWRKVASQAAEIERLREALNKERRRATDAEYFCVAYRNMLGPIGLKVAQMWEEKGVKRIHFSWGPAAAEMTGEERAQLILDWEYAPSREVSFVDNDAALTTGAAHVRVD